MKNASVFEGGLHTPLSKSSNSSALRLASYDKWSVYIRHEPIGYQRRAYFDDTLWKVGQFRNMNTETLIGYSCSQ